MLPSRRSPRPTLCRRGVRELAFALARRRRETRPGEMLLALRRRWHEGPADTTLLTSLRGWVSALLSRMGTQEMLSVMPPIAVSRWRVNPRQMGSRRLPARQRDRRPGSLKITSSCLPSGCFTVTLTAIPHLRARAGSQRASSQASLMPSPPRRIVF
jgi:hypothetical protein